MPNLLYENDYIHDCSLCVYSKKLLFDENGNKQNPCRLGMHDEDHVYKCSLFTTNEEIPNNDRVKRTIIKQHKLLIEKVQKNPAECICDLFHLKLSFWQKKMLSYMLNNK